MGKVKRLWEDKIDAVCEKYAHFDIDFCAASGQLMKLGMTADDASEWLVSAREDWFNLQRLDDDYHTP